MTKFRVQKFDNPGQKYDNIMNLIEANPMKKVQLFTKEDSFTGVIFGEGRDSMVVYDDVKKEYYVLFYKDIYYVLFFEKPNIPRSYRF